MVFKLMADDPMFVGFSDLFELDFEILEADACFNIALATGSCGAAGGGGGGGGGGCCEGGGGGGGGRSFKVLAIACKSLGIGGTGGGVDLLTLTLAVGKGLDFVYALLVSFATPLNLEGGMMMGAAFLLAFFLMFCFLCEGGW